MRPKRRSSILERAEARATALSSIDPKLAFTDGLSLATYRSSIESVREALQSYTAALAESTAARTALEHAEAQLTDMHERVLKGVIMKFGRDSVEYERAGGIRKSKIQRPRRYEQPEELAKAA